MNNTAIFQTIAVRQYDTDKFSLSHPWVVINGSEPKGDTLIDDQIVIANLHRIIEAWK